MTRHAKAICRNRSTISEQRGLAKRDLEHSARPTSRTPRRFVRMATSTDRMGSDLNHTMADARASFDAKHAAREQTLASCRQTTDMVRGVRECTRAELTIVAMWQRSQDDIKLRTAELARALGDPKRPT